MWEGIKGPSARLKCGSGRAKQACKYPAHDSKKLQDASSHCKLRICAFGSESANRLSSAMGPQPHYQSVAQACPVGLATGLE